MVIAAALLFVTPTFGQTPPSPADMQFTFAVRLMQQQDPQLAAEAFSDFVRDYGDDARVGDAHYYLAVLKRQLGDAPAAMAQLAKVKNPRYVTAGAVALLKGQMLLETGDPDEALKTLEPLNDKQFGDAPSAAANIASWHYLLGAAYRGAGNREAAAKQFTLAAAADTAIKDLALTELAKTQVEAKQWAKAHQTLKAVVAKPQAAAAGSGVLKLAGAVAEQVGKWNEAAGYYQRIVQDYQTSDEFGDAAVGWLRALFNAGDDAQVIKRAGDLAKLVSAARAKAGVAYWHAAALVRRKDYAAAEKVCAPYVREAAPGSGGDLAYLSEVAEFHLDPAKFRAWYDTVDLSGFTAAQRDHLLYLRAEAEPDPRKAIALVGPLIDRGAASAYAKAALLLRARLHEKLGEQDLAAADYQRYGKDYATDGQASAATAYAVDLAMAGGEYEKAIRMIGNIAKPQAAMSLKRAIALIKLGRDDEAKQTLDGLLADGSGADAPTRALAMYYQGLLAVPPEVKEGTDVSAALQLIGKAMDAGLPADQKLEALAVLARVQRMSGQTDAALKTYQQLRSVDPKGKFDGSTALWVGRGLLEGGDPAAAQPWFDAAMTGVKKDQPLWAAGMFGKAECERQQGQWDKAIADYRALLGYSSSYGEQGRLGLAQALAAAGQRDKAMEEYNGLLGAQASRVAATALMDSALIEAELAERSERAGDAAGAEAHRTEARRRLSRVVILYNQPELGALPVRAMVLLGRLEEAAGLKDRAREHYVSAGRLGDMDSANAAKPQAALGSTSTNAEAAWRLIGQAEAKRVDGQVGDAEFLFKKAAKLEGAGDAGAYAEQRIKMLGATP